LILGIGVDVVSVARMAGVLSRRGRRFCERVFTPAERTYCQSRAEPAQHYAVRFAAKEAALKALGVPRGLSWHELEVERGFSGTPQLRLQGRAAEAAHAQGGTRLHLSLSHSAETAVAMVVVER
jgi:holo-[acyl-carrier protein] synthase